MPMLPLTPFLLTDPTLGLDPRTVRRLVERGEVRRVLRGVGVRADLEDTLLLRADAARLVLGPGQVVVDHSASWLHGVDLGPTHDARGPSVLEVAGVAGRRATRRCGTHGCERTIPPEDVVRVHGVEATSPLRTAADLACRWGRYDALAVLDAFARHHHVEQQEHDTRRREPLVRGGWTFVIVRTGGFVEPGLSRWIGELRAAYEHDARPDKRRWARGKSAGRHGPRR